MHVICPFCSKHLEAPSNGRKKGVCPQCDNVFDLRTAGAPASLGSRASGVSAGIVARGGLFALALVVLAFAAGTRRVCAGPVEHAYAAGQSAAVIAGSLACALAVIASLAGRKNLAPAILAGMAWALGAGVWLTGTLILLLDAPPAAGAENAIAGGFYAAVLAAFCAFGLSLIVLPRLRGAQSYERTPIFTVGALVVGITGGMCATVLHARPLLNEGAHPAPGRPGAVASAAGAAPAEDEPALAPGLRYAYYELEESDGKVPGFGRLKPAKTGIVEQVTLAPARRNNRFAMVFEGYLEVPINGRYTFFLTSDDGSILYLDDEELINNDGAQEKTTARSKPVRLEHGTVPIRVTYAQNKAKRVLELHWQGPEIKKQQVPPESLFHRDGG